MVFKMVPEPDLNSKVNALYLLFFINSILLDTNVDTNKCNCQALKQAGWDIHSQIREEVSLTAGRVIVRGQMGGRSKGKRADFVLYHKPNLRLIYEIFKPVNDGFA
jgi:hypothetical protein